MPPIENDANVAPQPEFWIRFGIPTESFGDEHGDVDVLTLGSHDDARMAELADALDLGCKTDGRMPRFF